MRNAERGIKPAPVSIPDSAIRFPHSALPHMLTARGWWFLVVVVLVTVGGVIGLATYTVVPALLGVSLLAWFTWEWTAFQTRSNAVVARLRISRRILQGGRDVPMVWSGLGFEVHVAVE